MGYNDDDDDDDDRDGDGIADVRRWEVLCEGRKTCYLVHIDVGGLAG